jgi:hypothetical protein
LTGIRHTRIITSFYEGHYTCRNLGLLVVVTAIAYSATAATITVGGTPLAGEGLISSVAGVTTVDFNALPVGGPQSHTPGIATYSNLRIRSFGGTDIAGDLSRFAAAHSATGDLAISFSQPIIYFGLYWGSPDPLNTIMFYNGDMLLGAFTGQYLHDDLNVEFGSGKAAYVNFTAGPGESATRIVMSAAGSFPFEQDNHAFTAVPEASTYALTLFGLALTLVTRRRRSVN